MHPRDTVDRALSLSAQGVSDREVAARCGVSVGAVRKWRTGERRARDEADRRRRRDCPRCHDRPMDVTAYAQPGRRRRARRAGPAPPPPSPASRSRPRGRRSCTP
ncbi:helix-turn-helix domain-containing protein [Nonomuraea sp. NPDC003754]